MYNFQIVLAQFKDHKNAKNVRNSRIEFSVNEDSKRPETKIMLIFWTYL